MLLWTILGTLVAGIATLVVAAFLEQRSALSALALKVDGIQRELYEVKGDVKWLRYDRSTKEDE
jgi:hypothetical protein